LLVFHQRLFKKLDEQDIITFNINSHFYRMEPRVEGASKAVIVQNNSIDFVLHAQILSERYRSAKCFHYRNVQEL
jgi:hypothetical protein